MSHRHQWVWDPVRKPGPGEAGYTRLCKGCGERRFFVLYSEPTSAKRGSHQKESPCSD